MKYFKKAFCGVVIGLALAISGIAYTVSFPVAIGVLLALIVAYAFIHAYSSDMKTMRYFRRRRRLSLIELLKDSNHFYVKGASGKNIKKWSNGDRI